MVISGDTQIAAIREIQGEGVSHVIAKPFHTEYLSRAIQQVLGCFTICEHKGLRELHSSRRYAIFLPCGVTNPPGMVDILCVAVGLASGAGARRSSTDLWPPKAAEYRMISPLLDTSRDSCEIKLRARRR